MPPTSLEQSTGIVKEVFVRSYPIVFDYALKAWQQTTNPCFLQNTHICCRCIAGALQVNTEKHIAQPLKFSLVPLYSCTASHFRLTFSQLYSTHLSSITMHDARRSPRGRGNEAVAMSRAPQAFFVSD